jgi:ABC-type bacteriocin/lantibiotic exporter with double-glycine peptidase domain
MLAIFFLVASPLVASVAVVCGLLLLAVLSKTVSNTGSSLGLKISQTEIEGRYVLQNALNTYRESYVRGTLGDFIEKFRRVKKIGSAASADAQFLPNIGKYVIETSVLFIGSLIGLVVYLTESPESSAVILAMFLAASSRLAPALIRIQQANVAIRGAIGESLTARQLLNEIGELPDDLSLSHQSRFNSQHLNYAPTIEIKDLTYSHPGAQTELFTKANLTIKFGEVVAITGPSGVGKSTLLDLILGLTEPTEGDILIGGLTPDASIRANAGAISYLPQDVWISAGSVQENVTLGFGPDEVSSEEIEYAIGSAQLTEVLHGGPSLATYQLREGGSNLSGGQKQRLGLARALVTRPKILLLDEATSKLDKKTEAKFLSYLESLRGNTTVILVTHSSAVVDFSDVNFHISKGTIERQS